MLDSGNGAPHRIEGHLGVTSDIGIVQAWIDNIDLDTNGQADCCLELDHLKVAEPTAPSDDDGDEPSEGDGAEPANDEDDEPSDEEEPQDDSNLGQGNEEGGDFEDEEDGDFEDEEEE